MEVIRSVDSRSKSGPRSFSSSGPRSSKGRRQHQAHEGRRLHSHPGESPAASTPAGRAAAQLLREPIDEHDDAGPPRGGRTRHELNGFCQRSNFRLTKPSGRRGAHSRAGRGRREEAVAARAGDSGVVFDSRRARASQDRHRCNFSSKSLPAASKGSQFDWAVDVGAKNTPAVASHGSSAQRVLSGCYELRLVADAGSPSNC